MSDDVKCDINAVGCTNKKITQFRCSDFRYHGSHDAVCEECRKGMSTHRYFYEDWNEEEKGILDVMCDKCYYFEENK